MTSPCFTDAGIRRKADMMEKSTSVEISAMGATEPEVCTMSCNTTRHYSTFERIVELYEKCKACVDELERRGKIHLIKKYL
jgi:hypothetical protein